MDKSNLEKYLEEWYPGLQKETRTLDEVLAEMGLADAVVGIHRFQLHIDPA